MPVLGKTKQVVVSEFRCAEILEAARAVFSTKGFAAATVDDIADAAGVAKGTVYLYFKSKRDIYIETVRRGVVHLEGLVRTSMESEVTVDGKIRAFIMTRLAYGEANREFFRIYYAEFGNLLQHPVDVKAEFRDLYERQARILEQVLADGAGRGELRSSDPAALARLIYDMTRAVIAQRILNGSVRSVGEDAAFLFDVIWKGVGCRAV